MSTDELCTPGMCVLPWHSSLAHFPVLAYFQPTCVVCHSVGSRVTHAVNLHGPRTWARDATFQPYQQDPAGSYDFMRFDSSTDVHKASVIIILCPGTPYDSVCDGLGGIGGVMGLCEIHDFVMCSVVGPGHCA